MIFRA